MESRCIYHLRLSVFLELLSCLETHSCPVLIKNSLGLLSICFSVSGLVNFLCFSPTVSAGYQCEVDSLLCVNRQRHFNPNQEHLGKAADLFKQLLDHTSLFPLGTEHNSRYLYIMVFTSQKPFENVFPLFF